MELKKKSLLHIFWWYGFIACAAPESDKIAFKPLFPVTSFNQLLSECMELWTDVRCFVYEEKEGCYDCTIFKLVQYYSLLTKVREGKQMNIHPGNLEYLLAIFDKIYYESHSDFMQILIRQIKRKLVELL